MDSAKPHAIVFPFPYQGHINPMINLVMKLATSGFAITYIHTDFIHHTVCKAIQTNNNMDLFTEARKFGLDIQYMTIPDGFPLEFDRDLNFGEFWETMFRDFPSRVDELLKRIIASNNGSGAAFFLIADTSYTWPSTIAKKHNLIHVSLWTEPALLFTMNYHLDLLRLNGHLPYAGREDYQINYVPGVPSICGKDLMSYVKDPDAVPALFDIIAKSFEQVRNADFILCNTVHELELETISALDQVHPIYAVGPINFFMTNFRSNIFPKSLLPESDCTEWLKSKPHCSVLYVSFGSLAQLTENEIAEIAEGLLLSKVNFIWVFRPNMAYPNQSYSFPEGIKDGIKDRGLIVPWCDQIAVLSNPATGGFVTHCGWNSVLESMWYGVPMICYPFLVDQPTNRKIVVEELKIGVNLCDAHRVTREEVAHKVSILMRGRNSTEFRQNCKKVSKTLRNALEKHGSSERNFDRFVENLKARILEKLAPAREPFIE